VNKTLEQQRIIQQFKITERVLNGTKAPLNHNQSATTITSGVLDADRLGTGSALQVLRRNAANNALEFTDPVSGSGDISLITSADSTIAANTARIATDYYEIGDGYTLEIASGGILEVL
jgi:hypothetical protein